MHYDKFAFAKDTKVPTIFARSGGNLGNTMGFSKVGSTHRSFSPVLANNYLDSQSDLVKINRLYQCESPVSPTTTAPSTVKTTTSIATSTVTPSTTLSSTTLSPTSTTPATDSPTETPMTSSTQPTGESIFHAKRTLILKRYTDAKDCIDTGSGCALFYDQGFCAKSPQLMNVFCRRTCGFCTGNTIFILNIGDKADICLPLHGSDDVTCADQDDRCGFWAINGQCKTNPAYMLANCQKSCQLCN